MEQIINGLYERILLDIAIRTYQEAKLAGLL
jgi:hypothetical protein